MTLVTMGSALLTQISATGTYFDTVPGMLLWAFGASIAFTALNIAALAGTMPGREGLASGLITTSKGVGFPLGLAILLSIASATNPQPTGGGLSASAAAMVGGFRYAFLASTLLSGIGLVIALRIKSKKASVDLQPSRG